MNLLIVGPQASGKGTQAEKLIEKFGLAHVEMGNLLRNIAKEQTPLGYKVADLVNNGKLVPDELVIEILGQYLNGIGRLEGILFDGFPRIISQAEYFEKFLQEKGQKLDLVIYLTLPREEVFKRLTNRRTCSKCGKVFNLLTKPPKVAGVCDFCSGELIVRADETPEKINSRLDWFEQGVLPMIDFYRQKEMVEEIDGNRPIEVVFEDVVKRLRQRGLIDA